ncbi:hypothetical protein [Rhizobium phage RHph_N46]|nr:hypothetical protein EVC12_172 [Rhizobium phage RHph_I42]QXV73859.1 hypothetical protein [Rhizobium phage RHph_N46]
MVRYVVHKENTLGLIRDRVDVMQFVWLEVLAANVDGFNPKNGPTVVDYDDLRDATIEDFDRLRLHPPPGLFN